MRAKKKNKNNIIILIVLFFSIGIGYAIINSSLNINIGLKVKKNKEIYFDDVRIVDGSVTAIISPIADKENTKLNFSVNLSNVNDTYTFYIDMKNNKKIQYMLSEIIKTGLTEEQASIIDYNVYYENGDEIIINELFQSSTNSIKVEIKVKEGISSIEPQTLNLSLELKYVQATNSAIFAPYYYLKDNSISDSNLDFSSTNGTGIYELTESKNDEFPVYFYRGSSNNKVIFNNMCWNIIRTTDTGGTKLIYAGVPDSSGTCSNTSSSTTDMTSSKYNEITDLTSVGYMYDNTNQKELKKYDLVKSQKNIYSNRRNTKTSSSDHYVFYYYGTGTFPGSLSNHTCTYVSTTKSYNTGLKDKWTNFNTSETVKAISGSSITSCPVKKAEDLFKYYVFDVTTTTNNYGYMAYTYFYVDNANYNRALYFGSDYVKNEDGTYTLTDTKSVLYRDWRYEHQTDYDGKYVCFDNSDTCEELVYASITGNKGFIYGISQNIKFSKQVTYENGMYTLVDPIDEYEKNKDIISTEYNYSCLTKEVTCEEVAYIISYKDDYISYISLTEGEDVQSDSLMNFENTTDSIIKQNVDEWFANNMTNVQDKIEDTVYCNDRSIGDDNYIENGIFLGDVIFSGNARKTTNTPSVKCPLARDSFTMSPDLGNGKLTYPVGLITLDEQRLVLGAIQGSEYYYYTMTPSRYELNESIPYVYKLYGTESSEDKTSNSRHIRPVISLKYGLKFYDGDGSETSPYKIYGES